MYQTHRTFIKADMKMSGLIKENPRLLLLLEHFDIDFAVGDKAISQICTENLISVPLFLLFANLYNGFYPNLNVEGRVEDILTIIKFLKSSHEYYLTDKYPEIKDKIERLYDSTGNDEIKLVEKFFEDYFYEVRDHLDYEDKTAFPFFTNLIEHKGASPISFSAKEYKDHHTDIETKLSDLKNLLLKHIHIDNQLPLRRKLFFSLLELEFDLQIHALIEERILMPLIEKIERGDG